MTTHGTPAGYSWHVRRGHVIRDLTCECAAAHRKANLAWAQKNRARFARGKQVSKQAEPRIIGWRKGPGGVRKPILENE